MQRRSRHPNTGIPVVFADLAIMPSLEWLLPGVKSVPVTVGKPGVCPPMVWADCALLIIEVIALQLHEGLTGHRHFGIKLAGARVPIIWALVLSRDPGPR